MQINIKIILDAVKFLKMKQENKNLINKRIEIIHKLFDNFQLMRKKIESIKSKNLVNNQIYEEVKRRIVENKKFYDDKINDIDSLLKKKVIILKKVQKKFLEIQIYIRRECQNFYGFRKQFSNYSITPFLLENEILNRNKAKINTSIEEKMKYMKALFIPINEIKNKEKKKNEKNKNENVINFINEDNNILIDSANDELNKYIINKEEEINFYENKKMNLCNIKLLYKMIQTGSQCVKGCRLYDQRSVFSTSISVSDAFVISSGSASGRSQSSTASRGRITGIRS